MASLETQRKYLEAGLRFLESGQRAYPHVDRVEALCQHAEARTETLKKSTVRLYRQQYGAVLSKLALEEKIGTETTDIFRDRIEDALVRITGKPKAPNTSSKKVKDAKDWMLKQVFGHLKMVAVRHHRIRSAAAALYCLLVPKIGNRPVELVGARVEGNVLIMPNAKRADGQTENRKMDISDFAPVHREALLVLIGIVAVDVGAVGYDQWLSNLAEILARACAACSTPDHPIPRLAPSSFRHNAISTWEAAGYTAGEIAALAGHLSLRSAPGHYIHVGSAFPVGPDLVRPLKPALEPSAHPSVPTVPSIPNFVFEDPPEPTPKPGDGPNDLWTRHKAQQEDKIQRWQRARDNHRVERSRAAAGTGPTPRSDV